MAILNATYAPIYGEMEEVVLYWYSRKVLDGKSFADLFEFEGLPLGWFYERMFFLVMMPKQLNMYDLLKHGKKLTTKKKIEFQWYSSILPKLISLNEKRKRAIAKLQTDKIPTQQQKVLFLTFTNHLQADGSIYRLQEMIDEITKRNNLAPFPILVDPFSSRKYNLLKDKDSIYQYRDKEILQKAKTKSKEMHRKIRSLSEEQKKKLFSIGEKNFWPYCKYIFNFNFSREMLFQLMFHYYLFDKIIREEKITCGVLTSPGSSTEKCLIAAAKKNNIPALVIQHGMGVTDQPINNAGSAHYAVFGEYHQKQLLHWNIDKENIHITGPVIHNDISKYKRKKPQQKVKEILIATQTLIEVNLIPKETYFECFKRIIAVLQSIPDVHITIKTHPREVHHQEYDALVSETVSTNHLKGNENLYTLLSRCDLLINFYGTSTVLEAAILDKPSMTIDLPDLTQNFYQDYDPSYRIKYEEGGIKEAVQEMLDNPHLLQEKRERLVREWCYVVDGKAHQRVVDVIERLSGK
ncbi:MAG: CDP-glycerol glycerophosphotransferase family protein [Nanoarchaeota archaeon]|nr:CDP-glycerol glycerophosphotransferase family protein [Nanoarchaeota archaeon]